MLREKPPLAETAIGRCLNQEYGLTVEAVTFLPLGYDANAAVYRIQADDGTAYFLKLTRSTLTPASLHVPRALFDQGLTNVLAPLPTLRHELWCHLEPYSLILYPFIAGQNAMEQAMSDQQWRTFGTALKTLHRSQVEAPFVGEIPVESFATPMIDLVRSMQQQVQHASFTLPIQQEFAAFWQQNRSVIQSLTERAEQLGSRLRTEPFELVLCHGDIHAANIMLDQHGGLYIVDWDTLRIAPCERDLLFIIGSIIAHRVTPAEEACFFQGYGATPINWQAITYYRYERVLEELYEGGRSVFFNPLSSPAVKEADARFTMGLFQPGEIVQWAFEADSRLDGQQ